MLYILLPFACGQVEQLTRMNITSVLANLSSSTGISLDYILSSSTGLASFSNDSYIGVAPLTMHDADVTYDLKLLIALILCTSAQLIYSVVSERSNHVQDVDQRIEHPLLEKGVDVSDLK